MQQQKRLILALLISTGILFAWGYFVKPPQQQPPPTDTTATGSPSPSPAQATPAASPQQVGPPAGQSNQTSLDAERRTVHITTPLYEAKFDTLGAEAVSWIVKKNKDSGREIYSVASHKNQKVPLELVSPEGLKRQPRDAPFQIVTGDNSIDYLLSSSTYKVEGIDAATGDAEIALGPNEKKAVTFVLSDASTGLEIQKKIVVDAERYDVQLELSIKRGGQAVPQARLKVGPSIGDQGVSHHTFYSVAPEAVTSFGDRVERITAAAINEKHADHLTASGAINWTAIGDTYFAMVAVPSKTSEGIEYHTVQYDHPTKEERFLCFKTGGKPEKRYLISAFVPIPTDGSRTLVYVGPKDHYILTSASGEITREISRPIDLDGLIDYGWFSWLSRPIAVPILWAIRWLYRLTNSYGLAIILFTIVIYSLFFPLKWRSSKAMKKAQKLAPKMKELQEKMKGMKQTDPKLKDLQMEQLRLMREGNPLGGCLPLLIQMPFLFALYRAITISLDFRQATFVWLPDLSAGDPYHILEFLMAGTMIVLQLITPNPSTDPVQRKMMAIGMPIFMLYVLWGAPSGLLVYWLVGNIVGFSQQFLINHLTRSEDEQPPTEKQSPSAQRKKLATSKA
jgi:YidC/Oxa1 family membrane protein insertase